MAGSDYLNYLPDPGSNLRGLSEGNIDLIELTAFDVQIALTQNDGVQLYEVLKIMTEFMNDEFALCLASDGSYAIFDTVILLDRSQRRELLTSSDRQLNEENGQVVVGELYTAPFKGAVLFTRLDGQLPMPASVVEGCQRQAFLEEDLLLEKLQNSGGTGLGLSVVDVRAYINPYGDTQNNNNNSSNDGDESGSLEIVIIIAIVIACVAFLFLVFAIYWAWRYDKKNRDAYLVDATSPVKSPGEKSQETFDAENSPEAKEKNEPAKEVAREEVNPSSYPSVIGGDSVADGVYTDSVISEDINSSLSQYYQTGLASYNSGNNNRLQDAGSVSSMESYGYSLDGYAPSLATNTLPADAALSVDGTKRIPTDASAASRSKVSAAPITSHKKDP